MLYTENETSTFHEQKFAHLIIDEQDHLLTITLNRPEKKNAFNKVMLREVAYALNYAHYNNDVWAVVIAAKGDIFSAGADLKAFAGEEEQTNSTVRIPGSEVVIGDVFHTLHKPCIAKVHAPVLAGGFLLICGCTHVIAADDATFSLPEVKRGLFPFQVMKSMLDIMPARQVLDFCMRARKIDAGEAEKIGLISKSVDKNRLDEEVQNLVDEIFAHSPTAIRLGLEAFDELRKKSDAEAHSYLKHMLEKAIQTEDAAEGIQAFLQKRKPKWTGK